MGEERLRSSKFARNVDLSAAGCIEHLSGEMLGSRQRRLHRSDKFQLSLRQRDCTSIRETKLFPFHGKKRERGERASLVKERSCIVLAIQPTRLPFYHSSDVVSRSASSLRAASRRMEYRVRDTCRVRHPVSTIPSGNGASIV